MVLNYVAFKLEELNDDYLFIQLSEIKSSPSTFSTSGDSDYQTMSDTESFIIEDGNRYIVNKVLSSLDLDFYVKDEGIF